MLQMRKLRPKEEWVLAQSHLAKDRQMSPELESYPLEQPALVAALVGRIVEC